MIYLTNEVDRLEELYNLLISGDYLYNDSISFLKFLQILQLLKSHRNFAKCFKNSHLKLTSFLGILEFLQNVNVIKLIKDKHIKIQNNEIFELLYRSPSRRRMFLKLIRKIPRWNKKLRIFNYLKKRSLLKLYLPKFKLNIRAFQLPCSIGTSLRRAITIIKNINLKSQKAFFIGDDDLVSILCKFIMPELSITIIDIDGRITKLLKEIAKKHKFTDFNVYNLDIKEIKDSPEILKHKYSIIHFDPPYEAKELQKFFESIDLIMDGQINQVYLNGLFDNKSMAIINQFMVKNKLIISRYYNSFNSYPLKSSDLKYLKSLRKQIKLEYNFKFKEKSLKSIEFSSDFFVIEKG